jgi:hypothetical protein
MARQREEAWRATKPEHPTLLYWSFAATVGGCWKETALLVQLAPDAPTWAWVEEKHSVMAAQGTRVEAEGV